MFQSFQVRLRAYTSTAKLTGAQRIGGAINARIAEEQARQKAAQQTGGRARSTSTPRRSSSRNLSPSKRPLKGKDADGKTTPLTKGPDPSEFDPEFVVGDEDEQLSRAGTPQPKEKAPAGDSSTAESSDKKEEKSAVDADTEDKADKEPQLPADVQTRLRKLDKLEPKYSGGQEHPNKGEPRLILGDRTASLLPHRTCSHRHNRDLRELSSRTHSFDIYNRLCRLC